MIRPNYGARWNPITHRSKKIPQGLQEIWPLRYLYGSDSEKRTAKLTQHDLTHHQTPHPDLTTSPNSIQWNLHHPQRDARSAPAQGTRVVSAQLAAYDQEAGPDFMDMPSYHTSIQHHNKPQYPQISEPATSQYPRHACHHCAPGCQSRPAQPRAPAPHPCTHRAPLRRFRRHRPRDSPYSARLRPGQSDFHELRNFWQ